MDYKNKYIQYKLKYLDLKKQIGGSRFIGNGAYGCVYSPPLQCVEQNCVGDKCTHGISKLMTTESATKEQHIFTILKVDEIDREQKYHIGNPHKCTPVISQELLSSCPLTIEEPSQLIYENGGNDFYKLISHVYKKTR